MPKDHMLPKNVLSPAMTPARRTLISAYEQQRNERIAANRAMIEALGVPKASELFKETDGQPPQPSENGQKTSLLTRIMM